MKNFSLRIEDDLHKRLKHELVDREMSMQKYIISLIEKDLEKQKKKGPQ